MIPLMKKLFVFLLLFSTLANNSFAAKKEETALTNAADNNDLALVVKLLNEGSKPNIPGEEGYTALMSAAYCGNAAMLKALLDEGADPNLQDSYGRTALMIAASQASVTRVSDEDPRTSIDLLLEHKAKVDTRDHNKSTALMYALSHGSVWPAYKLMQAGADVFAVDLSGNSIRQYATSSPRYEEALCKRMRFYGKTEKSIMDILA